MLTNGVIIVNRLLSLSGQYKWKWKYHILLLKLCIDMFVFTNCPGLCLGHSVTLSVCPSQSSQYLVLVRENVLVSSVLGSRD